MLNANAPFVLLDDAREHDAAAARLYVDPMRVITAETLADVPLALDEIRAAQTEGLHAAGFLSYEAGYALERRFQNAHTNDTLLWFGLFRDYREIAAADVLALLPPPQSAWIGALQPRISRQDYDAAIAQVKEYIAAGDIYQANLTFPCDVPFQGHPLAVYAQMRGRARAGYGGVVFTGQEWLLSLSPELFFTLHKGKLMTKPMKGTIVRADDETSERAALISDPKQRAENLMIVDLLRNDLARVAEVGSVHVPKLFEVESYPSLHTMTSTITAQLRAGLSVTDVLAAIFPCGSITGAPKIRAMEIVAELERASRGAYTGSIGRIDPNGDAAFNVAIRTLHSAAGAETATIGLGSGVVADSHAALEWQECLDKGAFVATPTPFDLIETLRCDGAQDIKLLDFHMARLASSAARLGFICNEEDIRNALHSASIQRESGCKLRLRLSKSGALAIESSPLPHLPDDVVNVAIASLPVFATDIRLAHKTSDRCFYDEARKTSGAFEILFTDRQGFLTEGSFTTVFVPHNGALLTPPLSRGLLPGVLRASLLESGQAIEADLTHNDLQGEFYIGNALRGLMKARLA